MTLYQNMNCGKKTERPGRVKLRVIFVNLLNTFYSVPFEKLIHLLGVKSMFFYSIARDKVGILNQTRFILFKLLDPYNSPPPPAHLH